MSTDRLAALLPRLVVARKSCVCSTLARLHGAGNLHHGGDYGDDDDAEEGDDKEGGGGDDVDHMEGDSDTNLLTLLSWHKAALLPRHRLAHRLLDLSKGHGQHYRGLTSFRSN